MDCYIGEIRLFAGAYQPENWAYCDGRLMTINENQVLFSLIGTTYGGNGTTNFALPDLRGRVPVGIGTGAGLTPRALGAKWGAEQVTLTEPNLPVHNHAMTVSTGAAGTIAPNGALLGTAGCTINNVALPAQYFDDGQPSLTPVQLNAQSVSTEGGTGTHNNQQPYLVLNYIIALQGTYPQRA